MPKPPFFSGLREFLVLQRRAGHACRVVCEPESEETLPHEASRLIQGVLHLEGGRLEVRDTGFHSPDDSPASGFGFFLDAVQQTRLVAYIGNVPLVYHLSAAAILKRDPDTRGLRVWHWSGPQEYLLVPEPYLDTTLLTRLGLPFRNTIDSGTHAPIEAVGLRALAYSMTQRLRRSLEVEVMAKWLDAREDGWLMVDGPLMPLPGHEARGRMVGVVKSFGAQYFEGEEQLRLMSLPEGHRTTAFQLPRGTPPIGAGPDEGRRWFSWYVRIHGAHERDADFGLLRVEIAPDAAILAAADEISRWLVAERAPLSTPDPRWDNLLYPIHACEQYLRSMLPERRWVHLHLR